MILVNKVTLVVSFVIRDVKRDCSVLIISLTGTAPMSNKSGFIAETLTKPRLEPTF